MKRSFTKWKFKRDSLGINLTRYHPEELRYKTQKTMKKEKKKSYERKEIIL